MRSGIQVGPALRTQTLAVFTAHREGRSDEKPLFPDGRTKIDLQRLRIQRIHVRVVRLLAPDLGEDDVRFVLDVRPRFSQASGAFEYYVAFYPAVPVKPAGTRR